MEMNLQKEATTLLLSLYEEIYGPVITVANLNELAEDLSLIVGRPRPWTGKFLHSLIKGYSGFKASENLRDALQILASQHKGIDEVQARAKKTTVLTINRLPAGTVILGEAQRCATPGCSIMFVPTHPRQKYHSKSCGQAGRQKLYRLSQAG